MTGIGLNLINLGSAADSGDGSSAREGGRRINNNFVDIYSQYGDVPIVEETADPYYGCRNQAATIDDFNAQLHPSGFWQKVRARSPGVTRSDGTDANMFFMSRGEQVAFDFSAMGSNESYRIVLPLANKGDVVKIRDLNNTLGNGNRVIISASPYEYTGANISEWNWGKVNKNVTGLLPNAAHVNIGGVSRSYKPVTFPNTPIPPTEAQDELFFTSAGLNLEVVYGGDDVGWTVYKFDPFNAAEDLKGRELFERPCFSANRATQTNGTPTEPTTIYFNPKLTSTFKQIPASSAGREPYWEGSNAACNTIQMDDQWWGDGNGNSVILKNNSSTRYTIADWEILFPYPQSLEDEEDYTSRTITIVNDTGRPFVIRPIWKTRDGIPLNGSDFVTKPTYDGVVDTNKFKFIEGLEGIDTQYVQDLFVQFDASVRKVKYVYSSLSNYENGKANGWIITEIERTNKTLSFEREFFITDTVNGITELPPQRHESEFPVTLLDVSEQGNVARNAVINIITGERASQDPYFDADGARIQAIDMTVTVNGVEYVQGGIDSADFYPFYGTGVSLTDTQPNDYNNTPNVHKRYSLFNGIHFNTPLLPGDFVTVRWKTLDEVDVLETAAIRDIVESLVPNFISTDQDLTIINTNNASNKGSIFGGIISQGQLLPTASISGNFVMDESIWDAGRYTSNDSTVSLYGYRHKRSFDSILKPNSTEIMEGELAIGFQNGVLYSRNDSGIVVQIGLNKIGDDSKTGSLAINEGAFIVNSTATGDDTAISVPELSTSYFGAVQITQLNSRDNQPIEIESASLGDTTVTGVLTIEGSIESETNGDIDVDSPLSVNASMTVNGTIGSPTVSDPLNFISPIQVGNISVNNITPISPATTVTFGSGLTASSTIWANGNIQSSNDLVVIDDAVRVTGEENFFTSPTTGIYFAATTKNDAPRSIAINDNSGDFSLKSGHRAGANPSQDGQYITSNDGAAIVKMDTDGADGEVFLGTALGGLDSVAGQPFTWASHLSINPSRTYVSNDLEVEGTLKINTLQSLIVNDPLTISDDLVISPTNDLVTRHIRSSVDGDPVDASTLDINIVASDVVLSGRASVDTIESTNPSSNAITLQSDTVVDAAYKLSVGTINAGTDSQVVFENDAYVDGTIVSTGNVTTEANVLAEGGTYQFGDTSSGFDMTQDGSTFRMQFADSGSFSSNNDRVIEATKNGSTSLYHDGTKMIETESNGARVYGGLRLTSGSQSQTSGSGHFQGGTIALGGNTGGRIGAGMRVENDSTIYIGHSTKTDGSGEGNITLSTTQNRAISAVREGGVSLYYNNEERLMTTDDGIEINKSLIVGTDGTGGIQFGGGTSTNVWNLVEDNGEIFVRHGSDLSNGNSDDLKIFDGNEITEDFTMVSEQQQVIGQTMTKWGTVQVTTSGSLSVSFSMGDFANTNYSIQLTPQLDGLTVVDISYSGKGTNGFTIHCDLDNASLNGDINVDFLVIGQKA